MAQLAQLSEIGLPGKKEGFMLSGMIKSSVLNIPGDERKPSINPETAKLQQAARLIARKSGLTNISQEDRKAGRTTRLVFSKSAVADQLLGSPTGLSPNDRLLIFTFATTEQNTQTPDVPTVTPAQPQPQEKRSFFDFLRKKPARSTSEPAVTTALDDQVPLCTIVMNNEDAISVGNLILKKPETLFALLRQANGGQPIFNQEHLPMTIIPGDKVRIMPNRQVGGIVDQITESSPFPPNTNPNPLF